MAKTDFLKTTLIQNVWDQKMQFWILKLFFLHVENFQTNTLRQFEKISSKLYGSISCFLVKNLKVKENLQKVIYIIKK